MKLVRTKLSLLLLLALIFVFQTTAYAYTIGSSYVTSGSVNFRTGPSTSYSIQQKLAPGTGVVLISVYNYKWYEVSVNGKEGYLSPKYLADASHTLVTNANVNFRTGPSAAYSRIA